MIGRRPSSTVLCIFSHKFVGTHSLVSTTQHAYFLTKASTAQNTVTQQMATSNAAPISGAAGITTDDQTNAVARRAKGEFVRGVSSARNWIAKDGEYPPAKGRYHMYVA